ncbi:LysR family transcriptional regulator [Acidaminococcus massiliensis]|jgi:DNA-binding transcriptional LysR family regulator|uniref:LysR family transcriptional regulator n=1 Tax=Acidaminococcus massiliensis TaxID=1852375 RepID=UPI0022E30795|nr:LysR family transcriptional regulator [Acidaminococcus massiliensis]
MDIEEIKTFIELSKSRNFSRTADLLHVVQSTVSNRIRSLEEYVGKTLVIRDKTGIRLTAAGNLFLQYAIQIVKLDRAALEEIQMASDFTDSLNIASVQWLFDYYLKEPLIQYSFQNPQIATNLTIAHSEDILPLLQNRIYDVALISYRVNHPSLLCLSLPSTPVVFVGQREQYGYLAKGIRKEELAGIPLIYSDIWENYLSDISENIVSESRIFEVRCNMLGSAKAFCLSGSGCCFLPRKMVEKELQTGKLIQIPIQDLSEKVMQPFMICRRNRLDSPALKSWLFLLSEMKKI